MRTSEDDDIGYWLDSAFDQIGKSGCDVDMPDVIAYADFRHLWANLKKDILNKVKHGGNMPDLVEIVDLPKDRLTVRPLARLEFESRIGYEAAVFAMAEEIDSQISNSVYSYRLARNGKFQHPVGAWVRMQRYARKLHRDHKGILMARTDISSFFENINVAALLDALSGVDGPKWAYSYVKEFIHSFNADSNARGLPQGTNASQVLANFYLAPLDDFLERESVNFLRYSDDLYIFGSSFTELREVLLEITTIIRRMNLSLSGAKTKILDDESADVWIDGMNKDALSYEVGEAVKCGFPTGDGRLCKSIHHEFDAAVSTNPPDVRSLKFCLTQMGRLGDNYAVDWIMQNFTTIPHAAKETLRYIRRVGSVELACPQLVEILSSDNVKPYPYAQQHILMHLMHHSLGGCQGAVTVAWNLLSDSNNMGYVREMSARLIGKFGSHATCRNLTGRFSIEKDHRVRRALLVASYESGQCGVDFLQDVLKRSDSPLIRRTARYLMEGPSRIPLPTI